MSKFDIAAEMNSIITGPAHQSIFARPELTKTAAKKEDDKEKAAKEKAKEKAAKEKVKEKAEKEKAAAKAKAEKEKVKKKSATKYEVCVKSLCVASEILDGAGLAKASALTLMALDSLVTTAAKKKEEKEKWKKEEKKSEKKNDKNDAKGPPAFLKKDDKKEKKDDKKKIKKASDDIGDASNTDELLAELNDELPEDFTFEGEGDDFDTLGEEMPDWDAPEGTLGKVEDPEYEGYKDDLLEDEESKVASQKTSLQRLAEELGGGFLA